MPESVTETTFADFWSKVPHKIAKASAEKAWRKIGRAHQQDAARYVVAFYDWFAKTYPGASPLHPATYLSNKRWTDEGVKRNDISHTDVEAFLRKALNSNIPSVREHAQRMAERNGIRIGGDA
jgi:hypothetical protein